MELLREKILHKTIADHKQIWKVGLKHRLLLIGMEARPGSQWLARKLQELDHSVKIIPAQFVKPYIKSNKNDLIDAEAIVEAVSRPTMRFVDIKEAYQVDLQMLRRIRNRLVSNRTHLIC